MKRWGHNDRRSLYWPLLRDPRLQVRTQGLPGERGGVLCKTTPCEYCTFAEEDAEGLFSFLGEIEGLETLGPRISSLLVQCLQPPTTESPAHLKGSLQKLSEALAEAARRI